MPPLRQAKKQGEQRRADQKPGTDLDRDHQRARHCPQHEPGGERQDIDDLCSDVLAELLYRLREIRENPELSGIDNFASYTAAAQHLSGVDYFLHIIPDTVVGAFAQGEILQVLLFSVLFGLAVARFGERGRPLLDIIDQLSHVLFAVIGFIMKFAPIGAFGAMAFTIGEYGIGKLANSLKLGCDCLGAIAYLVAR